MSEVNLHAFGWNSNPFTFDILPESFVGYRKESTEIINSIKMRNKFSLILGTTGSGKTTLLKFIEMNIKDRDIYFIPKPPKRPEELIDIFKTRIKTSWFKNLFSRERNVNLYNLPEWVNRNSKKKDVVFLFDEIHEAGVETLEWIRTIGDHTNTVFVFAGLPVFEEILKENLETLKQRISVKVNLTNLTKHEMIEMIKKRIARVGGNGIEPFTSEVMDRIYEITHGFPREVLRVCETLVKKAIERNTTVISVDMLGEEKEEAKRISLDALESLPEKQRNILELINKYGKMSPVEIVKKMDKGRYKNSGNAIRSVNNILRRMREEGLVVREKVGRSYKYDISEKIRSLFIKA